MRTTAPQPTTQHQVNEFEECQLTQADRLLAARGRRHAGLQLGPRTVQRPTRAQAEYFALAISDSLVDLVDQLQASDDGRANVLRVLTARAIHILKDAASEDRSAAEEASSGLHRQAQRAVSAWARVTKPDDQAEAYLRNLLADVFIQGDEK
jgi:hypothetical protein